MSIIKCETLEDGKEVASVNLKPGETLLVFEDAGYYELPGGDIVSGECLKALRRVKWRSENQGWVSDDSGLEILTRGT